MKIILRHSFRNTLGSVAILLFLSLNLAHIALGQATAARPDRGLMPGASYAVSDMENISLTSGNVNLSIPLASLPPIAGGKLGFTLSAVYNSKLWNITRGQAQLGLMQGCQSWVVNTPQLSDLAGWRISGEYSIVFRDIQEDFAYVHPQPPGTPDCEMITDEQVILQNRWYRAILIAPDGSEHELRPTDSSLYYSGPREYLRNYYRTKPDQVNAPMRYHSLDGTYMSAIINPSSHATHWTVYLKDGTQVIQYSNGIQRIKDPNGNSIKIYSDANGTNYEDEQAPGRKITYNSTSGKIWYQTVGGIPQSVDIVWGSTTVQGKIYRVDAWKDSGGETGTGTACFYDEQIGPQSGVQLIVIREIVFPVTEPGQAARRFSFNYNSDTTSSATDEVQFSSCTAPFGTYTRTVSKGMGELSEITTPAGAVVKYSYSRDNTHNFPEPDEIAKGTVTQKQVTHDGTTDTWTYSIDEFGGTGGTMSAPDGSGASESVYSSRPQYGQYFGSGGKAGLSYRSGTSGKLVERHWITMPFSGANNNATGAFQQATFNPVVDAEYLTLFDGTPSHNPAKMSAKKYQYDYNGNVTQTTEYDWFDPALVSRDAVGVPLDVPSGAVVLRVVNHSYYNPATGSSSGNVYAKRSLTTATPLILSALKQITVGPSITRFSYDGQPYETAPTVGNLTSQSVWDDLDNKWITSSQTYGSYGNLATKTDPQGNVTQLFYDDATHALPNRIVVDPQNSTGQQTITTEFDYSTGLIKKQTDPNGNFSTVDYTNQLLGTVDPFGRPGITSAPAVTVNGLSHQRRTTTFYEDSSRRVRVESDLNTGGDRLVKARSTADQLNRPVLTEQSEDGSTYSLTASTVYVQMGKITLTSSPRRTAADTSDSWTRTTRDTQGRVTEVATFGGAAQPPVTGTSGFWTGSITSTYDANTVTVSDQMQKRRKSITDALGRLKEVIEDPTPGLNYLTSYSYDTLDNLTIVNQGSQTRTFGYDSLRRLRSATNPEVCNQVGPQCTPIPITYEYDDNGNLTKKTDARSIITSYVYDALNRNTTVNYSDTINDPDITRVYDTGTNGKGRLRESYAGGNETLGANVEHMKVERYDALGQPEDQRQRFKTNSVWSAEYQTKRSYNLAGGVTSQTYPSGKIVNYTFDNAGRTSSFAGNLGGAQRTYSTGIIYSPSGGMAKEQFGTDVPLYNKSLYNNRGQLAEIRVGTFHPTEATWWNRGAIINHYSNAPGAWGATGGGPDNNGNLKKQEVYIPNDESISGYTTSWQGYDYDSLNRLERVKEYSGSTQFWQQEYVFDRWGNRTIHQTQTWGTDINKKDFTVNTTNNQLAVPVGQSGTMTYDKAGNLTTDTYTGAGSRTYDAENRMTQAWGGNNQQQFYTYNADGQRVRRKIDGVETWQIYGMDGELLAEYPANGQVLSPQKEYGYRNGQLLITAEASAPAQTNFALASNGATASASSTLSSYPFSPAAAIDGEHKGLNWLNGGGWHGSTSAFPQWLEVNFNGSKTISEVEVFSVQDNYASPIEPTDTMTFSLYGLTGFDVQYWTGSAWATVTGGAITGNNKVRRKVVFSPVTTSKIRVVTNAAVDGWSRLAEVEVWGPPPANVALASNGATATASSVFSLAYPAASANNGDRKGSNWGSNGGWNDAAPGNSFPDWLQIDFAGTKTIAEVDVFTVQDNYASPSEPTESMTFSTYGLTGYNVQYWNGSSWVTLSGGTITGNNKVWRRINFTPVTTTKIRVQTYASTDGYSRITEVEAWTAATAGPGPTINWLVADQLGTPRMIIDKTGSLANVKRHDYLPFGEELSAGQGIRNTNLGYFTPPNTTPGNNQSDTVRQEFTSKERDNETGLDYFLARYYSSTQGRFTSPDDFDGLSLVVAGSTTRVTPKVGPIPYADLWSPQSINKYHYTMNNPLKFIDPDGHGYRRVEEKDNDGKEIVRYEWVNDEKVHDVPNNHVYVDTQGRVIQLYGNDENNYHSWGIVEPGKDVASDRQGNGPSSFGRWGDTQRALNEVGYGGFYDPHLEHAGGFDFAKDSSPTLHLTIYLKDCCKGNFGSPWETDRVQSVTAHEDQVSPAKHPLKHIFLETAPKAMKTLRPTIDPRGPIHFP